MRVLLVFACLALTACAPSTEALIREAQQSGNWSLVNKRLDTEEERRIAGISQCNDGQLLMCSTSAGQSNCSCVDNVIAREELRRMTRAFQATTPRVMDNVAKKR
jgi:hypothetical protein